MSSCYANRQYDPPGVRFELRLNLQEARGVLACLAVSPDVPGKSGVMDALRTAVESRTTEDFLADQERVLQLIGKGAEAIAVEAAEELAAAIELAKAGPCAKTTHHGAHHGQDGLVLALADHGHTLWANVAIRHTLKAALWSVMAGPSREEGHRAASAVADWILYRAAELSGLKVVDNWHCLDGASVQMVGETDFPAWAKGEFPREGWR